jgi:cytochrome c oxidase subunit II
MSEHGALLDALLVRAHWLIGGVLALAFLATLWLTLGRRLPRPRHPGRWGVLVMAAIVLFAVDATLAVGSRQALGVLARDVEADPTALRLEINARRWSWDVRYPGRDGRFATPADASPDDIVLTNELVVPAGAPVLLQIAAMDVVHAFNIPALRIQVEAIPGHLGHSWFRALAPGEHTLLCAQHCGPAHYRMRGLVRVLAPEEFAVWQAKQQRLAELAFDPDDADARWGWPWRAR